MQGGKRAAKNILRPIEGKPPQPFHYLDKGKMATIGWNRAVAEIGPLHLSGFPAWFIWATIHIAFLIGYRSRFSVMWQWMWAYVTRNRSARLIIGHEGPVQKRSTSTASPRIDARAVSGGGRTRRAHVGATCRRRCSHPAVRGAGGCVGPSGGDPNGPTHVRPAYRAGDVSDRGRARSPPTEGWRASE